MDKNPRLTNFIALMSQRVLQGKYLTQIKIYASNVQTTPSQITPERNVCRLSVVPTRKYFHLVVAKSVPMTLGLALIRDLVNLTTIHNIETIIETIYSPKSMSKSNPTSFNMSMPTNTATGTLLRLNSYQMMINKS